MEQRKLGNDGMKVGAVGLGCMSFGGMYGSTDEAESHAALSKALDLGVTHLDVSNIYGDGRAEEVIGSYLKANPGHRFVIATKAGIKKGPPRSFDNTKQYLADCLHASLKRLGVDHVELFYIHRRDQSVPIEEVVETLAGFKREGKIGGIGFSEIAPYSLERAHAVHPVTAVQNEYSLWTRLPELGMVQATKRLGVALVAFSPVARGMLTASLPDPAAFEKGDFRSANPRFQEPNFSRNLEAVRRFATYASERGHSPEALAIAWVLNRGDHIIPIPGTRTAAHLTEDAKAAEIRLSAAEMAEIEAILPVGFAHGDRYSDTQTVGPERYC